MIIIASKQEMKWQWLFKCVFCFCLGVASTRFNIKWWGDAFHNQLLLVSEETKISYRNAHMFHMEDAI